MIMPARRSTGARSPRLGFDERLSWIDDPLEQRSTTPVQAAVQKKLSGQALMDRQCHMPGPLARCWIHITSRRRCARQHIPIIAPPPHHGSIEIPAESGSTFQRRGLQCHIKCTGPLDIVEGEKVLVFHGELQQRRRRRFQWHAFIIDQRIMHRSTCLEKEDDHADDHTLEIHGSWFGSLRLDNCRHSGYNCEVLNNGPSLAHTPLTSRIPRFLSPDSPTCATFSCS